MGDPTGATVGTRRVGPGRVIVAGTPESVLRELSVAPDVQIAPGHDGLLWTHRRTATDEIYFVANQGAATEVEVSFRATAAEIELWHPDTGLVVRSSDAVREVDRTRVRLSLDASGSCFVISGGTDARPAGAFPREGQGEGSAGD